MQVFERMNSFVRTKWYVFTYNFSWPNYVNLFEGPLVKASIAIPLVGYLILFNDTVADHIRFETLTNAAAPMGLSASARLQFVYCGLLCLATASAIYFLRRPYALTIGRDEFEYVTRALEHFSISNYIDINGQIKRSGHDPHTQHGKYYDSEFEGFLRAANGDEHRADYHWVDAKNQYEGLLRSMLKEHYFRQKITRRVSLVFGIGFAYLGYILLLIPSVDLFVRVLGVIQKSIF